MGVACPCCSFIDIKNIDNFNKKFFRTENLNTKIKLETKKCILNNIGQEGFINFCSLYLKDITILNLSNNNIEDITALQNFRAPKLEKLDLSYNSINDITIFQKLKYPLKELDLRYNLITDITIFKNDNIFPKLTKLYLNNNDFDSENIENENIMNHLKERMEKNMEKYELQYINDDDSYKKGLRSVKTINDKFILPNDEKKINILDKDAIQRVGTLKKNNEGEKALFDECIQDIDIVQSKLINTLKLKSEDINNCDTNSSNSFQNSSRINKSIIK